MSTRTGSLMIFDKSLCYNELDKIVFFVQNHILRRGNWLEEFYFYFELF